MQWHWIAIGSHCHPMQWHCHSISNYTKLIIVIASEAFAERLVRPWRLRQEKRSNRKGWDCFISLPFGTLRERCIRFGHCVINYVYLLTMALSPDTIKNATLLRKTVLSKENGFITGLFPADTFNFTETTGA
jgi:hypothetical protein